jgi:hypothetical protein
MKNFYRLLVLGGVCLTLGCANLGSKNVVTKASEPTHTEILAEAKHDIELDQLNFFWQNEALTLAAWMEDRLKTNVSLKLISINPTSDYRMAIISSEAKTETFSIILYLVMSKPDGNWKLVEIFLLPMETNADSLVDPKEKDLIPL